MGKKLRLVFFGLILVLIIGFVASRPNYLNYGNTLVDGLDKRDQKKALENINRRDIDNDGLKDWEEDLWNTDPKNPDTDGDGTKDGDEVDDGRNPNLAGPNDEYQGDILVRKANPDFSNDGLTETEKFSKDFFQDYISLRDSGGPISESDKDNLINTSVSDITRAYTTASSYTESDLNISQDVSGTEVKKYGNLLGEIILKHSFETEDELTIFNRSVTTNNVRELEKLDPIINGYKKILRDSLAMSVPKDAISEHISFIKSIAAIAESIENMRTIYTDPIRAVAGIGGYEQGVELLENSFDKMRSYFIKKDVAFGQNEAGFILINVI